MKEERSSEEKFVSVIVCAYNEEKLLSQCTESLLNQIYPAEQYEIIIVDDESEDKTPLIAQEWLQKRKGQLPRMKYIRIKHGGLAVARNTGIKHAEGGIIAFIDGDAIADGEWLNEIVKPFEDKKVSVVGGKIDILNKGNSVAEFIHLARHKQLFGPKYYTSHLVGCNMAYRKKVFEIYGGFNENFVSRGDETSFFRRIRQDCNYYPAPEAIVYHERPESVIKIVQIDWKEKKLYALVQKVNRGARKNKNILLEDLKEWGYYFEGLFITLFPLVFVAFCISSILVMNILFPLSTFALIRRFFVKPINRIILKDLLTNLGILKGFCLFVFYNYLRAFIYTFGVPYGFLLFRTDSLIPHKMDRDNEIEFQTNV